MIVACVRTGTKYGIEYVERLRKGVARHLNRPHRFICLTDRPDDLKHVETVLVPRELTGWWGKMKLFDPAWRRGERVIYFDLDTVIVGNLAPLADLDIEFGICENFTKRAGHPTWPCKYGSCVMTIGADFDGALWDWFRSLKTKIVADCGSYGDQKAIEMWSPEYPFLQHLLPRGFLVGYRDLANHVNAPPIGASVIVFAGSHKPHNTNCAWARRAWEEAA